MIEPFVFISYRRSDAAIAAQGLYRQLQERFSCKESQLITPSVSAVAARNGLTDWRLRSKNKPRRNDVASRSQPRRERLTNVRIV